MSGLALAVSVGQLSAQQSGGEGVVRIGRLRLCAMAFGVLACNEPRHEPRRIAIVPIGCVESAMQYGEYSFPIFKVSGLQMPFSFTEKRNWFSYGEPSLVEMPTCDGRTFRGSAKRLFGLTSSGMTTISIHLPNMTLPEAYAEAQKLAEAWELGSGRLAEWYEGGAKARVLVTDSAKAGPSIQVLHSFSDTKPWYVEFEISFQTEYPYGAGSVGRTVER